MGKKTLFERMSEIARGEPTPMPKQAGLHAMTHADRCRCAECLELDQMRFQGIPGTYQMKLFAEKAVRTGKVLTPRSTVLTLNLNGIYFDEIAAGTKTEEYRLASDYWRKRLERGSFERIVLLRGYPKGGGEEGVTRLTLPWRGFVMKTICHPHFGPKPVEVFAIAVAPDAMPLFE